MRTAVSCPPSLLSQGHRYLWGMSSIQVTVPIVFWGRRPPSHEICSICKPDNRSGMATGCRSGQICIWDLHKRYTTGETVVRLSGDLILQVSNLPSLPLLIFLLFLFILLLLLLLFFLILLQMVLLLSLLMVLLSYGCCPLVER